eukprot:15085246-Ditylum_brightwellii.AAC.1
MAVPARRGISSREAGGVCYMMNETKDGDENKGTLVITMDNIHRCTTFQLRQELKKRGYFLDDYNGVINYKVLLAKLVQLLQQDKEIEDTIRLQLLQKKQCNGDENKDGYGESDNASMAEKMERAKAARKAAAVQRSQQRQLNKNYFEAKKKANEDGNIVGQKNQPNEEVGSGVSHDDDKEGSNSDDDKIATKQSFRGPE